MKLADTGVTVRDTDEEDAVAGVLPRWVAMPESVEEIAAVLRACAEEDLAVVPAGGGTKLHWGAPPERCDVLLDLCCMNEVLEHASGDLVVRVQAGVTMDTLAERLASSGQELALDVPFMENTTVGGTLATATAGPRSFRYGGPRDLLIGITVVLADGTIARSGGKVVKNVAGYDLGKLFTGSYGTLGVIAEATFRLHPLPAERVWITGEVAPEDVQGLAAALAASQAEPTAVEVDWLDPRGPLTVAVLVEGATARARADALNALVEGEIGDEPPPWWGLITSDDVLIDLRCLPGQVGETLDAVRGGGLSLRGSPVTGRFHLESWGELTRDELAAAVAGLRKRVAVVTVTASPYQDIDRYGEVPGLALMRRVKDQFDPGRRMSPGRFVGGI
ncbi:FAD-binding oxidoreductase [Nonomuraea sp. NPDC050536]|uniref:FAD-binding oxidoreductase n=1 Tax=Nonomuraea sp. NPDC050536 TaxID=3364366 RepID=UPI0037C842DD